VNALADRLPSTTRSGRAIAAARRPSSNLAQIRTAALRVFAVIGVVAFVAVMALTLTMAFAPAERSIVFTPSERRFRLPEGWRPAEQDAGTRLEQHP
jgi:hypothetical protein